MILTSTLNAKDVAEAVKHYVYKTTGMYPKSVEPVIGSYSYGEEPEFEGFKIEFEFSTQNGE